MKKYLEYIGLCKNTYKVKKEIYEFEPNEKLRNGHRTYLTDLIANQNARQSTIENKNSQILGQSSVLISIVALFIPFFASSFRDTASILKIVLILNFIVLVFHFSLSIYHAIKMLEIDKHRYMAGATTTVTKENRAKDQVQFDKEVINDMVRIINHNNSVTNKTAANLVYASRAFKLGIISFLSFSVLLLISSSFLVKKPQENKINNLKEFFSNNEFMKVKENNELLFEELRKSRLMLDTMEMKIIHLKSYNDSIR